MLLPWRELFTRPVSAEAARVNNSRHNVAGAWAHYFFKYHKSVPLFLIQPGHLFKDAQQALRAVIAAPFGLDCGEELARQ